MQMHPPEEHRARHRRHRYTSRRRLVLPLMLVLATVLASWLAAPFAAADDLQPFQASYLWYWHSAPIALSSLQLQHRDDDTWVYDSTTRPRGIGRLYPMRPVLHSLMRVTAQGVQPLEFIATGSGRRHDADVKFDWDANRATGIYEGAKIDLPIQPGVQDDLSVQIAMIRQLLQGHTPDAVMEISKDEVREYNYDRASEEMLDTTLGRIDTIVYVSHHAGSPRTTRFWCAPSLGFIPVQVQQKRLDAVEWTMRIRSLKGQP
jgi:hypothetical protein